MGLIKSSQAPAALSPFSLKDIEDHARSMLLKARLQVEQLLVAAQQEAEAIKTAAHAEGLAEGRSQGLTDGNAAGHAAGLQQALTAHNESLTKLVQTLTAAVSDLNATRTQLQEKSANAVLQLAIAIARKTTHLQGQRDPSVVIANVEAAARLVVESHDVRIAVNPQQRQTLTDALPELKLRWPSLAHVELVEDGSIAPGGCAIRTRGGVIDTDLNTQVDRIAAELLP